MPQPRERYAWVNVNGFMVGAYKVESSTEGLFLRPIAIDDVPDEVRRGGMEKIEWTI